MQEVRFPKGLTSSPVQVPLWYEPQKPVVQEELINILTWVNHLAFTLKQIDLGGLSAQHREQPYLLELIKDLGRTLELKQLSVKKGSSFAALVEQQVRPTYNDTPTVARYLRATKKRQHELALTRGTLNVKKED
ncbi:hypothetical protein SARC_11948 [Sphaeroforma arctica JP610]|uniref:Uncharacterized protein n=1 Tax=Sphaeroforma arctica JP610 TaxID=667725 RepID=A0A0L0FFK4_9EUKA|nr:hypothetical protein SARC_11948 [Sphaeroforma arctica JP610]KNC75530.1 hypothetical protein SARC_11948 [Sphaeroforma arctica JP610]|eukprot:XP_014149432.1 hypothetical protein SARC_11948 [Sphaeroforma arctica JP610]